MTAPSLTEFLLARIAEDEEWARRRDARTFGMDDTHFNPARVLAECEAKRHIVMQHYNGAPHDCAGAGTLTYYRTERGCPTLRLLTMPYKAHPDFREEWRA